MSEFDWTDALYWVSSYLLFGYRGSWKERVSTRVGFLTIAAVLGFSAALVLIVLYTDIPVLDWLA